MDRAHGTATAPRLRTRPHFVFFSGAAGWVLFVAIVGTLLICHNDLPPATNWSIVGWCVIAATSGVVGPVLRWTRTLVEVDDARARCTSGVLRARTLDLDLETAREVAVEQEGLGGLLGYAHLRVVDAGGSEHVLPPVGDVAALRAIVPPRDRRPRGRR